MNHDRPLLLDLFCGAGGAAKGYHDAGFDVVGVDINPQPNYPYEFHQGDALDWLTLDVSDFAVIHASPPCQRYSTSTASTGTPSDHPDLLAPVRSSLGRTGLPYVIENVPRAPVRRDLMLCGSMFGLQVRRHRHFEFGGIEAPEQPRCQHKAQGRLVDVTGHAGGRNQTDRPGFPIKWYDVEHAREIMQMPWADGKGCTEAIPPAYSEYIGVQLIAHVLNNNKEMEVSV